MKRLPYILAFFILLSICTRASAQSTTDASSLVKEAVQLNKEKKYAEAVDKYTLALKLEPDNTYANYGIAFSLLESGKGADGIPYLEKVVKANTSLTVWAYDLLGSIYDRQHDSAKAIAAFNAGIKADPQYQLIYYNLGLVYFRDKNYAEAEKCAIQAIKLDPKHANSQRMYALVCFHQNKRANALLGLCSYILLQRGMPQTAEAYDNIQHILQGGALKLPAGAAAPVIDANTAALNQAITQAVAETAKKKYATQADLLTAQLTAIFTAIGPLADKQNPDDFFTKFFADYFFKLAQSPNMPAFAHLVSQSTAESAEWIKNNAQQLADLDNWVKGTERGLAP
jgi:tetratricopeptide (TPR) repeat protein